MQPKGIGKRSIHTVLLNSALPFRFAYAHVQDDEALVAKTLQMYEEAVPDDNAIVRTFIEIGVPCQNAAQSQALLQLQKNYCERNRCYLCPAWRLALTESKK